MPVQFTSTAGSRQTFYSTPADTNAATIYSCQVGAGGTATVEALHVATTGAANITAWINDGTDHLVLDAVVQAADIAITYDFGNPVMRDGYLFKVKTSNADDASFMLTVAEEFR